MLFCGPSSGALEFHTAMPCHGYGYLFVNNTQEMHLHQVRATHRLGVYVSSDNHCL